MIYILSVYLQNDLNIIQGLKKLFGLGFHIARLIINDLNIGFCSRIKDLNQNIVIKILKWIELNKVFVETSLKQKIMFDIANLKRLKNNNR